MKICIFSRNIPNFNENAYQLQNNIYSLYQCKEKNLLKNHIVFFDGIIYNLDEIKDMVNITDDLDIEVILLKLYKKYGDKSINIIDGAYSVVIIDNKGKITFFRDMEGLEKLYYYKRRGSFIISNTLRNITKFLKPHVDTKALPKYFLIGHVNDDSTLIKNISQPELYEVIRYSSGIWSSSINRPDYFYKTPNRKKIKSKDIEDEIERILTDRIKFLSDMFPGEKINTLSGGTDSSLIQYILKKLGYFKSYGVNLIGYGFDAQYSNDIANHLKTNHKLIDISLDDYLKSQIRGINCGEGPNIWGADVKLNYMYSKINENRKNDRPILCFDGEGAETTLGYSYPLHAMKYFKFSPEVSNMFNEILIKRISKSYYPRNKVIIKGMNSNEFSSESLCTVWVNKNTRDCVKDAFNLSDMSYIFEPDAKKFNKFNMNIIEKFYRVLFETLEVYPLSRMRYQLSKSNDIHLTFPFRDKNLVKSMFEVPTERKIALKKDKYLEKKLMSRIFPKELVYRKKVIDIIPYTEIFRNNDRFVHIIEDIKNANYKYFNFKLDKVFYKNGYVSIAEKLITFHIWHKLFIENITSEDIIKDIFDS